MKGYAHPTDATPCDTLAHETTHINSQRERLEHAIQKIETEIKKTSHDIQNNVHSNIEELMLLEYLIGLEEALETLYRRLDA